MIDCCVKGATDAVVMQNNRGLLAVAQEDVICLGFALDKAPEGLFKLHNQLRPPWIWPFLGRSTTWKQHFSKPLLKGSLVRMWAGKSRGCRTREGCPNAGRGTWVRVGVWVWRGQASPGQIDGTIEKPEMQRCSVRLRLSLFTSSVFNCCFFPLCGKRPRYGSPVWNLLSACRWFG